MSGYPHNKVIIPHENRAGNNGWSSDSAWPGCLIDDFTTQTFLLPSAHLSECIQLCFIVLRFVSLHLARIYLASNLDKQPCNYYFQPCENTMYVMVRESGKKTL